jgi:quercetin dioxygenase-like cupin family protein
MNAIERTLAIAASAALLVVLGAPPLPAQDVAKVNAATIKVTLDNARVRVMEATIAPGAKEAMHSHPAYIIYVVTGGKARNHAADGTTADVDYAPGATYYREPLTHWAENVGTTTIRLVLVELKQPASGSAR